MVDWWARVCVDYAQETLKNPYHCVHTQQAPDRAYTAPPRASSQLFSKKGGQREVQNHYGYLFAFLLQPVCLPEPVAYVPAAAVLYVPTRLGAGSLAG